MLAALAVALPLAALALPAATAAASAFPSSPASVTPSEPGLPAGAGGLPVFNFAGWQISCPTTSWCLAAGVEETASQLYLAMAMTWSSGSWSSRLLPVPGGGLSLDARPNAVTCSAAGSCVVVGDYYTSSGGYGLVDTLSAGSWSSEEVAGPPSANQAAQLESVSCPSATGCVAAGQYELTAYGIDAPFVATLSNSSWTSAVLPEPLGASTASIASLSCPSTSSCVAVGSWRDSSTRTYGLIETLSGVSWSEISAPVSGGIASPGGYSDVSTLSSVSCTAVGTCVAVGQFEASTYAQYPLVDQLVGGTWKGIDAGTVSGSPQVALLSVSCYQSSSLTCAAVGWWNDNYADKNPLSETYNGSTWKVADAAEPANVGSSAGGDQNSELNSVSCPSSTCVAAGYYETSSKDQVGLVDTVTGSMLSAAAPPPPDAGILGGAAVTALACPAAGTCIGAGIYQDYAGNYDGMTESGWGSSFTAAKVALPASPPADPEARISAVACQSVSSCIGVGSYVDSNRGSYPLIETEAGGTWQSAAAPEPAGAGTDATGTQGAMLSAITCPSEMSCVAVGAYRIAAGQYMPLIEVLAGGAWTALTAPLPADARLPGYGLLTAVSCAAPGACVAVGRYMDTASGMKGLIVSLSGGSLTATGAPEPANGGNLGSGIARFSTGLSSVSCSTAGSCVAVGSYPDTSGKAWGLIVAGDGSTWSATEAPQPADAAGESSQYTSLSSVSCPVSGTCFAVGGYEDITLSSEPLVVSLSGGSWAATAAPKPPTASSVSGSYSRLSSISCSDTADCAAVGDFTDPSSNYAYWGMVDTLSGGSWSAVAAADPPGAATGSTAQYALLQSVDCPSSSWCVAAGVYHDSAGSQQSYLETGAGSSWSVAQLALPANASSQSLGINSSVGGVACASDGSCEVAGSYLDSGPTTEPFVDAVLAAPPTVTGLSLASGPASGGDTTTVTGTGFFPGATVSIGGVAASAGYESPTSLQVLVPPGLGTVDVRVSTSGGTSAVVAADAYTYDPAPETVSFVSVPPAEAIVGGSYTPVASASSGLPVTFAVDASSDPGVCTVAAGTVSFTAAGTCVLDAEQAGDADYLAARATETIVVGPASETVSFVSAPPAEATVGGSYTPVASASSGLPVTFAVDASSDPGVCTVAAGTVSFTAAGTCVLDAEQGGDTHFSPAAPVQQQVVVGDAVTAEISEAPTATGGAGTTLQLGVTLSPPPSGGTVRFSATVAGAPLELAGCGAVPVVAGSASCSWTPNVTGPVTVVASFSGAGATGPVSTSSEWSVPAAPATRALLARVRVVGTGPRAPLRFGAPARFELAGTAAGIAGRLTYFVDGQAACRAAASASCTARLPASGRLLVLAEYSGPAAVVVLPLWIDVALMRARWHVTSSRRGSRLTIVLAGRPLDLLPVRARPRGEVVVSTLEGRLLGEATLRPLPGGGAIAAWSGEARGPVRVVVHGGSDYSPPGALVAGALVAGA